MSIIPDELKTQTFPCPNCRQIVSSSITVCTHCSFQFTDAMLESAVIDELNERSRTRIRNHKFYMTAGIIVLLVGIWTIVWPTLQSYLNAPIVNFSCWTPIFLVGGIVSFLKGLVGYREEKRKIAERS